MITAKAHDQDLVRDRDFVRGSLRQIVETARRIVIMRG